MYFFTYKTSGGFLSSLSLLTIYSKEVCRFGDASFSIWCTKLNIAGSTNFLRSIAKESGRFRLINEKINGLIIYLFLLLGDQNVSGMHVNFLFFKTDSYGRSWRKPKKSWT